MKQYKNKRFAAVDILLLILTILPIAAGIVLNILTEPASDGIQITGARIFFTIHMPVQDCPITEAQINSWLVILSVFFLCLYITHGITEKPGTKRQLAAEWIVEKTESLVKDNKGE